MNAPAGDVLLSEVAGRGGSRGKERRAREIEHVTFTRGHKQQSLMLVVSLPLPAGLRELIL